MMQKSGLPGNQERPSTPKFTFAKSMDAAHEESSQEESKSSEREQEEQNRILAQMEQQVKEFDSDDG